jgi:DNA-binding CsgD family transcriptional regulator
MATVEHKDGTKSSVLTKRERQVVALVCGGHQNKAIASVLGIKEGSVKRHLSRIYRKFGGRNRGELITMFSQPKSQ